MGIGRKAVSTDMRRQRALSKSIARKPQAKPMRKSSPRRSGEEVPLGAFGRWIRARCGARRVFRWRDTCECDCGSINDAGNHQTIVEVTSGAVWIDAVCRAGVACSGVRALRSIVLVDMVSEMLRCSAALMLAIAANRSPGDLERNDQQEQDTDPATWVHGEPKSSSNSTVG